MSEESSNLPIEDMQVKLDARPIKYDGIDAIIFYFHGLVTNIKSKQERDCDD